MPPIWMLPSLDDEATAIVLVKEGAQDYLVKGWVAGANFACGPSPDQHSSQSRSGPLLRPGR
ncbi:MAG: hypothetical protein V3W14_10400 [Candidatus Neomarinimicrobiota bacterium]